MPDVRSGQIFRSAQFCQAGQVWPELNRPSWSGQVCSDLTIPYPTFRSNLTRSDQVTQSWAAQPA